MTEEEKKLTAVRHVVHDYVCLVSAGTSIYGNPRPPINSHVQYSFLVFCRKFGHFFMNSRGRGMQDMAALDFVGRKVKFKKLLPTWFEWNEHMDKHLFHLSYERLGDWDPWTGHTENQKMLDEFRAAWRLFMDNLPAPLKAEFDDQITKKLALRDFQGLDLG